MPASKSSPSTKLFGKASRTSVTSFLYRYNCDERTVIAAVVQFHRGLWFTIFASSDQRIIEFFNKPEVLQLPASVMVRPGNLLGLLPEPAVLTA